MKTVILRPSLFRRASVKLRTLSYLRWSSFVVVVVVVVNIGRGDWHWGQAMEGLGRVWGAVSCCIGNIVHNAGRRCCLDRRVAAPSSDSFALIGLWPCCQSRKEWNVSLVKPCCTHRFTFQGIDYNLQDDSLPCVRRAPVGMVFCVKHVPPSSAEVLACQNS